MCSHLLARFFFGASTQTSVNDMDYEIKHATGDEKLELEAEKAGKEQFGPSVLRGAFGTKDVPVVVPTVYEERIVGCVGKLLLLHDASTCLLVQTQNCVCIYV
jgi:hypothetical protein